MDIRFDHQYRDDLGWYEVVPLIDGVPLTTLIDRYETAAGMHPTGDAYGGLPTRAFTFETHYHGTPDAKTIVLGCSCGEWGCWPLMADIIPTPTHVRWQAFEQPFRPARDYRPFGPFTFARTAYDTAVATLTSTISAEDT